ncbi:deoxyguanosinetriphosphate triphosphohydrolase-like protein [Paucimonas lemoignei]|nr:deoxyguanosinetriphosphate triphosphohydrolase-like protein [Paucimonas lemoignei]
MSSMNWDKLLNDTRLGGRAPKTELGRSPFHSDHDKVIFSGAFRRLARKTQVHPLATNDHVHNRLTHSLEVACLGRTLGMRVGQELLNRKLIPDTHSASDIGDIVQTACLAHDIGNPPFGHTGEEAIRHWFSNDAGAKLIEHLPFNEATDLRRFEGNAQGFRVLTTSEYHPYEGGMRLTYASLGAFIKYPWLADDALNKQRPIEKKYGVYQSELGLFEEVADATGLLKLGEGWRCRHPLAHLMEISDDFCYAILDLEDGVEMGIIEWDKVFEILVMVLDGSQINQIHKDIKGMKVGRRLSLIRGKVISAFVDAGAAAFMGNHNEIMTGKVNGILDLCEKNVRDCVSAAKNLARDEIFQHPRKVELEIGAYSTLSTLLNVSCAAALDYVRRGDANDSKTKRVVDLLGLDLSVLDASSGVSREYGIIMQVLDYVSGMTDNYAMHLARQFNGMGIER